MNTAVNIVATIILAAIVAGLAYGIWGMGQLWDVYDSLEPQTRLVVLTGIAVVIVGTLIIAWGLRSAARVLVRGRLNDRRLAVYGECITRYASLLDKERAGAAPLGSAWRSSFGLTAELTLLAGPGVLETNQKLSAALHDGAGHREEMKNLLRDLISAMRRDLCHRESGEELPIPWNQLSDFEDIHGNGHSETNIERDANSEDSGTPRHQH